MADVIVIGAGLSGLAAAHRLQTLGLDVRVLERARHAGGHARTHAREGWRHEVGPNSFVGGATAIHTLAKELGLTPVAASAAARKRYLFVDGKLQVLPSNPLDAITTPLLPPAAKLRVLAEPLQRRGRADESVREFFDHRLGPEITARFVDPFVSGSYAGDLSRLGVAAAFPKLFELVEQHGSVIRGALAQRGRKKTPTVRGTFSFAGGMGALSDALAHELGDRLELGVDVKLAREGGEWIAGSHRASELILATPADAAATLLESHAPELSTELRSIDYASLVGVHLLLRRDSVPVPLDGFGLLVPRREGVRTLGCLWSSAMFDVTSSHHVALTCFIGGAHDPRAVELSHAELLETVRSDLARMMGIEGAPIDAAVVRHPRAIPQYGLRHLAWKAKVEALAKAVPGLLLASNYLDGVSMNDAVARGERVAREVAARRGAATKAA